MNGHEGMAEVMKSRVMIWHVAHVMSDDVLMIDDS
jgi:hypothetical protein